MNKKMRKKTVRLDAQTQYIHPFEAQITWQPKICHKNYSLFVWEPIPKTGCIFTNFLVCI